MREAALHAALDEMIAWLETPASQVAIFDATNSTESRRQTLVRYLLLWGSRCTWRHAMRSRALPCSTSRAAHGSMLGSMLGEIAFPDSLGTRLLLCLHTSFTLRCHLTSAAVPVYSCAQKQRFHGHFQYLFIESICNDQVVLEQNYRYKMMYSPDYAEFLDEQVPF